MAFKMEFGTGNAAFENYVTEIDHIFAVVAEEIANARTEGLVWDSNGNEIGKWELIIEGRG